MPFDRSVCAFDYLLVRHRSISIYIVVGLQRLAHVSVAGFDPVAQNEAQHRLRCAACERRELFDAPRLGPGKFQWVHRRDSAVT
jgi:hypothetical protein